MCFGLCARERELHTIHNTCYVCLYMVWLKIHIHVNIYPPRCVQNAVSETVIYLKIERHTNDECKIAKQLHLPRARCICLT